MRSTETHASGDHARSPYRARTERVSLEEAASAQAEVQAIRPADNLIRDNLFEIGALNGSPSFFRRPNEAPDDPTKNLRHTDGNSISDLSLH